MKRVLIVQPSLQPPGGGNGVAAWIVQALRDDYRLDVLAWESQSFDEINRGFGTSLGASDFTLHVIPARVRHLCERAPLPLSLLKSHLLLRHCRRMNDHHDAILTVNNEADFGRRGIQYVHFPWSYLPRPTYDLRWYHVPQMIPFYQHLCARISGFSFERMRRNFTLVNSDWTGRKLREQCGLESTTVHPPVAGTFPDVPWDARENGFVCIGRISPEKELEKVIEIVGALRSAGHDVHLHLVGSGGGAYYRRVRALAGRHAEWVEMNENLSRQELVRLVAQHRYGIHGMSEEHFGMAVAELMTGGSIVFVPCGGGQVEIVGGDERLCYRDAVDAVAKIVRTLQDPGLQRSLREHLATRIDQFRVERFTQRIRDIVRDFCTEDERP